MFLQGKVRRSAPSWRFVSRLGVLCTLGLLLHGGCSVDDRVLTDEDLGSTGGSGGGGRCAGLSADNACEGCLYDNCCEETRACAPGSDCAMYFGCVDGCAGDRSCLDDCAAQSPDGLLDALDLGVCSQRQCPSCATERDAAFEACDPNGSGACQSIADCSALEEGALESLDVNACPECEDLSTASCATCLSENTGLSQGCSRCVADWLSCAVVNCLLQCEVAADDVVCGECLMAAGCTTELGTCGFSG